MGTEWEASGICLVKMSDGCFCEISHEKFATFRNNLYICNIACYPLWVRRAVLFYEKGVFERTETYAFFVS